MEGQVRGRQGHGFLRPMAVVPGSAGHRGLHSSPLGEESVFAQSSQIGKLHELFMDEGRWRCFRDWRPVAEPE